MSPGGSFPVEAQSGARARIADYGELVKIRITSLVALTAAAGYYLAPAPVDWLKFAATVGGTALVSGGAGALNQIVERDLDGRMARTRRRPLPSGRMGETEAAIVALACAILGSVILLKWANPLTAALSIFCLAFYIGVYTPLKTRTTWNTMIGAVAGAVPPVLGWTGATGALGVPAAVLFGILFLWQLPHFFAIAWMYRQDYADAGYRMLSVEDSTGAKTSMQALIFTILLTGVAALPFPLGLAGKTYFLGSLVFGAIFFMFAVRMARGRGRSDARGLLLASIVYLPAVLGLLVLDKTGA